MVHNYGPGKIFASIHIEVDADGDLLKSHDMIDNIERMVKKTLHIEFVAHMDPVVTSDPLIEKLKALLTDTFSVTDWSRYRTRSQDRPVLRLTLI